jgi:cold shock CspA family protein
MEHNTEGRADPLPFEHMSAESSHGVQRKRLPKMLSVKSSRPIVARGTIATGRIVKMMVGQSYGFIRLTDDREVFFHRADLREGTAFNDLHIGDAVTFELLEDAVSGARALRLMRLRER